MKYKNSMKATFIKRPNRFIAICKIGAEIIPVHVKNTSRCTELLIEGAEVYVEYVPNKNRKTDYSLIAVKKGNKLFNLDSQVPNEISVDAIAEGVIELPNVKGDITLLKREVTYRTSRFDIYAETSLGEKCFIEVKGVTLEDEGIVKFPGAPTTRGVKHIKELIQATEEGYKTFILFVIQTNDISYLTPYVEMDKKFSELLREAANLGVEVIAYDCHVTENSIEIAYPVEVRLYEEEYDGQ